MEATPETESVCEVEKTSDAVYQPALPLGGGMVKFTVGGTLSTRTVLVAVDVFPATSVKRW